MDYGKFKFDEAQRAKESRRKAVHVGIKEMKYRPKIGPGDYDTKTRQVAKFLGEGHKVKITIMFRGREVFHPELGKRILDRIAAEMEGMAKVEAEPKLDNRNMIMVLAPDKRAKQSAASKAHPDAPEGGHPEGSHVEGGASDAGAATDPATPVTPKIAPAAGTATTPTTAATTGPDIATDAGPVGDDAAAAEG
jgi:translation initiation factor IF-3